MMEVRKAIRGPLGEARVVGVDIADTEQETREGGLVLLYPFDW